MDEPATILIADDDSLVRSIMRASLEDDGHTVIEAEDGMEAERLCWAARPDLMVLDVLMPKLDGYALCRELRRHDDWSFLPIVMVTGLEDAESISKAFEVGATDFIGKPVQWQVLSQRVRYLLRASRAFNELKENEERLQIAVTAAESANKAKTDFLANMSHELRTPLNAIIGFASLIRMGAFGRPLDKHAEYSGYIVDSGEHLLAIINDILDITRAEASRLVLSEEEVEIERVVALSTSIIEDMAENAGVDYRVEIEPGLPRFYADAAKLRQILINLLSNAIKFTPPGGQVRLKVGRDAKGGLALRIADTGIGIAREELQKVLTPFGQVESILVKKFGGVGLGLPLTKRLVELHGGTMEIASQSGAGTVVTALIPEVRSR